MLIRISFTPNVYHYSSQVMDGHRFCDNERKRLKVEKKKSFCSFPVHHEGKLPNSGRFSGQLGLGQLRRPQTGQRGRSRRHADDRRHHKARLGEGGGRKEGGKGREMKVVKTVGVIAKLNMSQRGLVVARCIAAQGFGLVAGL